MAYEDVYYSIRAYPHTPILFSVTYVKMMGMKQRAFTLIELLVVIAIIGILSAIVLASLDTARNKAADAAMEGDLDSARSQAENYYDALVPNTYSGVCSNNTTGIENMLVAAQNTAGASTTALNLSLAVAGSANTVTCHDSANPGSAWAAEVPLKNLVGEFWCVDSTGTSSPHFNNIAANATACTAG